jgi:glucose-1-phosphate cytidylyltransferase
MTYGDGLADVDLDALLAFHKMQGRRATVTVVKPPGRFGVTIVEGDRVTRFIEKPEGEGGVINGGFFVLELAALDGIEGDLIRWEEEPLQSLALDNQLSAFRHDGYWQPMDTLRDKRRLELLWQEGNAPWNVWS